MQPLEIFIYDIVEAGSAAGVIQQIRSAGARPIALHINSPGGNVFDGYAIYNALLAHVPGVTVYVDGLAASVASYIAMAGRRIVMAANAMMMIHQPAQIIGGTAEDMRRAADLLDKCSASIVAAYAQRTKLPAERIDAMLSAETWLTADEAKLLGFADEITEALQLAARFDMSQFRNAPQNTLMNPLKAVITLLVAALPGCTLTDASAAADVEAGVRSLIAARDEIKTKVTNLTKAIVAGLKAAMPSLTLMDESSQADIAAGVTALASDRDSIRTQFASLAVSITGMLSAAMPGKVTLTETSSLTEIQNAFKLLVTDRDGQVTQVVGLTTERDTARKHVGLLEVFAKSKGLDISGIDPAKALPVPVQVVKKSAKDFDDRIRAAGNDPRAVAAIMKEFDAAVKAGTIE